MKPHALALATAATLTVLPAAAHAKGIERVLACGSDGCADVTQRLGIGAQTHAHVILSSGQPTSRPSGAKVARIDVGLGDGSGRVRETISLLYAPAAGRIRSLTAAAVAALALAVVAAAARRLRLRRAPPPCGAA